MREKETTDTIAKKNKNMEYGKAVKALRLTDPNTQKPVTAKELTAILKEDIVYARNRPGSWEGANMLEVLSCHGFFNHHQQKGEKNHAPHTR